MFARDQIRKTTTVAAAVAHAPSFRLQRKCACGGSSASGECEECKKKQVRRKAAGAAGSAVAPPIVHDVLRSPGQPLDGATRGFFESRFGHDFSRVRVHADHRADASARAVNALAYTVGNQLVFQSEHYSPGTGAGRKLLAHELAHVIQQGSAPHDHSALTIGAANDSSEQEADRLSHAILTGRRVQPAAFSNSTALRRQPQPPTSPGPPQMPGPDWGLTCDTTGKCSLNTPAGDVPLERERYRCYVLARQGNCPPSCEDDMRQIGVPCTRPTTPGPLPGGGGSPPPPINPCPPGEIPYSGRCLPFHPHPPTPEPTPGPTPGPGPSPQAPPAGRLRIGTIESETLDNFPLNSPAVPAEYAGRMDHLASLLNIYRDVEVHIEGHTDGSGNEGINRPLSRNRAEAVKAELIRRRVVNPGRLRTQGFSAGQPLVTPATPSAQEPRNRRVEIWYYIPQSQPMSGGLHLGTSP